MIPHAVGTDTRVYLCPVFCQVEDYDPFIDTLDYVFHTPGIRAVEVTTQVTLPSTYINGDVLIFVPFAMPQGMSTQSFSVIRSAFFSDSRVDLGFR